jgi:hypothetical protein
MADDSSSTASLSSYGWPTPGTAYGRLPVSAGQAAQDPQRCGQARYGIETLFGVFANGPHVP